MNKKYLLICVLPFLLPACQSLPQHHTVQHTMHNTQKNTANLHQTLSDYTWSYQAQKNLPDIRINFDKDQTFSISTGCNQQGGSWQLSGQAITTSVLRSTMMMCSPQLMLQEKQSADLFGQSQLNVQVNFDEKEIPQLQIIDKNGRTYQFQGHIKPEAQYKSEAEIIFLDIAPTTKPCSGNPNTSCLQVKEIKYNDQGIQTYIDQDWKTLPESIQGYQHDPKIKKTIRIKRFHNKDNAPQFIYIYDMTVQQEMIHP